MEVCGFHGIVAGCLVAVKQLIPDTEVTLVRVVKFQARVIIPPRCLHCILEQNYSHHSSG